MGKKQESPASARARRRKTYGSRSLRRPALLISLAIAVGVSVPTAARAGIVSDIVDILTGSNASAAEVAAPVASLQTLDLARPATNIDPSAARGGGDIVILDDTALLPDEGPSGTIADIEKPKNATISVYVVRPGDTLASIAKLHDVSPNTIRWANDIPAGGGVRVGQTLTILPVTGIRTTVKKGDTIQSIAKRTGADAMDIANYNGLAVDDTLEVGTTITIPDGEAAAPAPAAKPAAKKKPTLTQRIKIAIGAEPAHDVGPQGSASENAYYMAPLSHYIETQGIHGYNGVDLAAPIGTPIMASAGGQVIVAKAGGYNGGYGSYVVIQHANGSQTLYAHMSRVAASGGDSVQQGEVIGYVGSTGKSTGAHLHFEIRNGIRNPF